MHKPTDSKPSRLKKVFVILAVILLTGLAVGTVLVLTGVFDAHEEKPNSESSSKPSNHFRGFEKPIIYLYPEHQAEVSVKLHFDGSLFASYPDYPTEGWQVTAHPDGKLIHEGKEYGYLFWEGIPGAERTYDLSAGFVIKGTDTREFLQEKLAEIGLTPAEYNEFIVYWYPRMQSSPYNLIHFATYGEYEKYAELDISPKPDSMLRVFMVFKPLDAPQNIEPQVFPTFTREGFTVVEWGGSELSS